MVMVSTCNNYRIIRPKGLLQGVSGVEPSWQICLMGELQTPARVLSSQLIKPAEKFFRTPQQGRGVQKEKGIEKGKTVNNRVILIQTSQEV